MGPTPKHKEKNLLNFYKQVECKTPTGMNSVPTAQVEDRPHTLVSFFFNVTLNLLKLLALSS